MSYDYSVKEKILDVVRVLVEMGYQFPKDAVWLNEYLEAIQREVKQ